MPGKCPERTDLPPRARKALSIKASSFWVKVIKDLADGNITKPISDH
jgi:hypothetical protein